MATMMRHRAGAGGGAGAHGSGSGNGRSDERLPLHRKEAREGAEIKPYDRNKHRKRVRMAQACVKCLSYAIVLCVVLLVLVLRFFDKSNRVRDKVDIIKNQVLGNTAKYEQDALLQSLLATAAKAGPAVNGKYVVFCTVSSPSTSSAAPNALHVGKGSSEKSPLLALKAAQAQLPRKSNHYPYVKIDVVTGAKRYDDFNYYAQPFDDLPSSWFGLAFSWGAGDSNANDAHNDWVFLPEEVKYNALVDRNHFLRWERLAMYAARSGRSEAAAIMALPDYGDDASVLDSVYLFHTEAIMMDMTKALTKNTKTETKPTAATTTSTAKNNQPSSYPLFHGHAIFNSNAMITHDLLISRAQDAGAHLAQIVKDTGRQVYRYNPRSDYEPFGYNLQRHAGTLYSMACIYPHLQNDSYLKQSMALSMKYLQDTAVRDCPLSRSDGKTATAKCVVEIEGKDKLQVTKVGVNAVTILAICEYVAAAQPDNASELVALAKSLAAFILDNQRDGNFVQKMYLSQNEESGKMELEPEEAFYNRYAHGQAALALARMTTRLHKFNPDPIWNTVAQQAVAYMIHLDNDDAGDDEAKFVLDGWLLSAMGELGRTPSFSSLPPSTKDALVAHARKAASVAAKFQNTVSQQDDEDDLDRIGIFYDDLSSPATAIKSEGLCSILSLLPDPAERHSVMETLQLAMRYQLQTQYQPEVAMYMRQPQRVLGGFAQSIVDTTLRNDYTHHNLVSMLCVAQALMETGPTTKSLS